MVLLRRPVCDVVSLPLFFSCPLRVPLHLLVPDGNPCCRARRAASRRKSIKGGPSPALAGTAVTAETTGEPEQRVEIHTERPQRTDRQTQRQTASVVQRNGSRCCVCLLYLFSSVLCALLFLPRVLLAQ